MAKKMLTGTLTVTFKVTQTDGAVPETLDALQDHLETEWDGLQVYFADPEQEEETEVTLETGAFEIITG